MRWDPIGDRGRAQHLGVAEADDARSLGPFLDTEREADRPELGRQPAVGAQLGGVADHRAVSFSPAFSSTLAASHSASRAAKSRSRRATPRSAAWRSTLAKRRRNLS